MWTQDLRNLQWLESFSMSLLAAISMREQLTLTYVSYVDTKTCNLGIYIAFIGVSSILWSVPGYNNLFK